MDVAPWIAVTPQVRIPSDHPGQVAAPVSRGFPWPLGEPTEAHELVVGGEERALVRSLLGPGDVLPAALGQEAMVAAGDQLGAVFKRDPVARLDRGPVGQHLR